MDALADAESRAIREARQARWGAIWAGTVTLGAIAWVLSGLPRTPPLAEVEAFEEEAVHRVVTVSPELLQPLPPLPPLALKALARYEPPPAAARTVVARNAPPRAAQARAQAPRARTHAARTRAPVPRMGDDARIRSQVARRLEGNPRIWGRIGIESRGSVVYLTGYTLTSEQARRAEREARKVRGVRAVRNAIRPRGAY